MSAEQPLDAVAHHAPWAVGEERQLRLRLHRAQVISTARAARERNGRARALYFEAAGLAIAWVFRRVEDLDDLERILRALNQIFVACDNIVQTEGRDGD